MSIINIEEREEREEKKSTMLAPNEESRSLAEMSPQLK